METYLSVDDINKLGYFTNTEPVTLCNKCHSMGKYKYRLVSNQMTRRCVVCGASNGNVVKKENLGKKHDKQLQDWSREVKSNFIVETPEGRMYQCQMCKDFIPIGSRKAHAHHVLPKAEYPEKMFDVDNGTLLCTKCHKEIHSKGRI